MVEQQTKLDESDKGTLKMSDAFETMLRSEGWNYYRQILEAHKKQHLDNVMKPTIDDKGIYQGERDKAAVVALSLALNIPKVVCEEAAAIRKKLGADPDGD